jgi:dienelactone hydrolase
MLDLNRAPTQAMAAGGIRRWKDGRNMPDVHAVLFHYGANDPYIPTEQIDAVEGAFAGRSDVVLHRYDAGHAFSNWDAPSMYDEKASNEAWARTISFLTEHLQR